MKRAHFQFRQKKKINVKFALFANKNAASMMHRAMLLTVLSVVHRAFSDHTFRASLNMETENYTINEKGTKFSIDVDKKLNSLLFA